ncbi:hypothetical protein HAX54_048867 [Datura stramonium]|uniref:Cyclopropane-fatty-acyl-phospholipid synthase n=1 Tax=Datura stramonium TaxID=4076 RepID=A0ABS8WJS9_DATST|nr:hypothetical protein [Datura stramonium]
MLILAIENLVTRQIRALGFDDKFMRIWEFYFDYCAAGFKTCTLGDYQVVFSRPGMLQHLVILTRYSAFSL